MRRLLSGFKLCCDLFCPSNFSPKGIRQRYLKLKELGAAVGGIDYATVSAAIRQLERRSGRERELAELIKKAHQQLLNLTWISHRGH
jgi:hypothetical protein